MATSETPDLIDRIAQALDHAHHAPIADEHARIDAGKRSRAAAVAALLRTNAEGQIEVLLIRRAERAGDVWSGHMALPGGRREPGDASYVETAIRETREEVDVDLVPPTARLLGALPILAPMSPQLPPLTVYPFVWSVTDVEPQVSDEVAAIQWVTLAHLRDVEHRIEHRLPLADGTDRAFPAIALGSDVLWGMTHRIVHTLLDAVDQAEHRS